ncbi:hypothetical protein DPMN_152663 [Dreissena polymorpha]|uniref:Uncharacterized protein n=1 Tax=Dreissena polymorpha TaxID=45954 RepID=A0A9D4FHV1_DREPO|nr:hypothetical protein DPMN_152663 [Dreissena polymorpha]
MYDDANTMSALAHGLTDKVATVEEVAGKDTFVDIRNCLFSSDPKPHMFYHGLVLRV